MIDAIQSMFPQVSSAAIRYDLERNGGDIEATTEKILAGGTLREVSSTPPPFPFLSQNQHLCISDELGRVELMVFI